jgi:hypothetical protein
MSSATKAIAAALLPITAEIKCLFLENLDHNLSIDEKRVRMIALDHACNKVRTYEPERFISEH